MNQRLGGWVLGVIAVFVLAWVWYRGVLADRETKDSTQLPVYEATDY